MGTYTITLKNCAFYANHGAFEQEVSLGQRFFVDVVMDVEADEALENDDVGSTVHYGIAYEIVEKAVTEHRRNLIEALAKDIAKALCAWSPRIRRADITVRKPSVPIRGILDYAEVRVEHFA
ncbi:dihydroneopterin aldolase [Neorhizobium sp. CSC1952]|uniref:dihydroneopterin aldolase n=1 Tax=Neorhizobium TaxID=1525371 RepID=UPI0025A5B2FB|nr:dihydroneopterin aldolase [Rhizobium sp. CSC1952]WJR66700.1 dihydroneopterin aldolase [Rhizobium sp. CSC1952]